ncbi:MAG: N-acetylmuramoyl-L-alanine amidase [Aeromicrobium sp.]
MRLGGKLFLSIVVTGLILSGCHSVSKSPQAAQSPSASTAPDAPEDSPAPAKSRSIAVPAPVRTSAGLVAELAPTKTVKFALLGVTWDQTKANEDVTVEVRVRKADGWSHWETLEVDDDDEAGRGGTEPWWVEDADEVGARVTTASGASPTGVKVFTVDPGAGDTPEATVSPAFHSSSSAASVVSVADGQPTYTPRPAIISRSHWRAKPAVGCNQDGYKTYGDTTLGVNIHHTAGSNSYSKSQTASIVRGIQQFHQDGRDWCDIAYNFIIDKYGQIFEGRNGGYDKPVRGSHSGDNSVNELTMGVALMGNLDTVQPSTAMKTSAVRLAGWRLATFYKPAVGTVKVGSKTLNRISGHRNVVSTACPGKYGYAWISADGGLRDRVESYISNYTSPIRSEIWRLDKNMATVTGGIQQGEYVTSAWRRMLFQKVDIYWVSGDATAFNVTAGARTLHRHYGLQSGVFGFPTSNMNASAISGLSIQTFQHGAIYRVSGAAASYALWGDIFQKYVSEGGPGGALGKPTASIVVSGSRKTAKFEHGTITQVGTGTPTVVMAVAPAPAQTGTPAPETTEPELAPTPTEEGIEPTP